MPTRSDPYPPYQCTYCAREVHHVVDTGPSRRLWCGRCACTRTFARVDERLRAETWPPPARQGLRLVPQEEDTP